MIGQWYDKDVNDGWVRRTETSELTVRTIEELSLEFVPQTFKRYFQNFLLKANQQFVEILPKTYIFQSRSIYNSQQSCVINQGALGPNILICK